MEEKGYFHASEDKQSVRDIVFPLLLKATKKMRIDSVIAQKNKANPVFYGQPVDFYQLVGGTCLKYALNRAEWQGFEHVVMVFSSLFDRKKRGILKQTFKSLIKRQAKVPYSFYFHDSKFDLCNQAVDYFGWAIYRKWESGDKRSYDLIRSRVQSEFDIFAKGIEEFYSYKK